MLALAFGVGAARNLRFGAYERKCPAGQTFMMDPDTFYDVTGNDQYPEDLCCENLCGQQRNEFFRDVDNRS